MPTELGILKLIHILCLVYWLGADLGVFYSSYFLIDEKLSREIENCENIDTVKVMTRCFIKLYLRHQEVTSQIMKMP